MYRSPTVPAIAGLTDSVLASESTSASPANERATRVTAPAKANPTPSALSASRRQPRAR